MSQEFDEHDDPPVTGARLTLAQVDAAIRALAASAADWSRLETIAGVLCGGVSELTGDDLLHEALTRCMEGRRVWPADVHPVVVVKNAMRSIASDARKRAELSPVDETVALADGQPADETDVRRQAQGKVTITPEDSLSGKEQLVAVYAAVAGDEEQEMLVMAWADGLRGDEAAGALDWDKKKYEAARKRLERRLKTVDPDRRTK